MGKKDILSSPDLRPHPDFSCIESQASQQATTKKALANNPGTSAGGGGGSMGTSENPLDRPLPQDDIIYYKFIFLFCKHRPFVVMATMPKCNLI